ncbi:MAG: 4-hydroxy-3-methylbut-2-enyl diphosphate reductase [Candidatus Brocadiia bacterium]
MKVVVAEHCGYCMGVNLAINKALETAKGSARVWTVGPLIHNRQAVAQLEQLGIHELANDRDLKPGDTVLVRAHGIPKSRRDELASLGVNIVDATCPHVRKAQEIIAHYTSRKYSGIIIGDEGHAEIISILGNAEGPCVVVPDASATGRASQLSPPYVVICQTTYNITEIDGILAALPLEKGRDIVVKTICRATTDRQEAALKLAGSVEVVFVVGGLHSANTRRLAAVCATVNPRTFHIETAAEITPEQVEGASLAGVTAGASTPSWVISEVVQKLEGLN